MDSYRIALVGATGAVGSVFLRLLEERQFPAGAIRLCASERSWGKKLLVNGEELTVEEATPELLGEVDIVFIAAGSDVSRMIAPLAVKQGAVVVDKSSAFRMDPDVPLVVPEVNPGDLDLHNGIIASPNCSTAPLVMALKPLNDANPVRRVVADTYQSVSGTGAAAMAELREQTPRVLDGRPTDPQAYPHQIAFNVLPHIEDFHDNGYTNEEMKMVHETRKILHLPDLQVSATCARVPVMVSHSEAVHVEFTEPMGAEEARDLLSRAPGVRVVDDPAANSYPTPVDAEGKDDVFVGRIRRDASHAKGLAMWLVSDNLRKGAALNAIQIAEELIRRGLIGERARFHGIRETDLSAKYFEALSPVEGKEDEYTFEQGKAYYEANLDRLLAKYEGMRIAIMDDAVVDSDVSPQELGRRVYSKYGYREIYMPEVRKEKRVVYVRPPMVLQRKPKPHRHAPL